MLMNENNDLSAAPSGWALSVADCPDVCPEVLRKLAAHKDVDVRIALAENHNLPEKLLLRLTDDENPYVAQRAQKTLSRLLLVRGPEPGARMHLNVEQSRDRRVPALLMAVNAV